MHYPNDSIACIENACLPIVLEASLLLDYRRLTHIRFRGQLEFKHN